MKNHTTFAGTQVRLVIFGFALAGAFILGTHLLAGDRAHEVFALFLALTACVYGGATLNPGATKSAAAELPVVSAVFALSVVGLVVSPLWLAVGYLAHGGWDLLHHYQRIRTPVIRAFPPVCATFDFAVGVFILL